MFLSGLKSRQVDSVKLPPIRCDPLNMRHQDFNIIFQPPKEATSGFELLKSVALNRDLTVDLLNFDKNIVLKNRTL